MWAVAEFGEELTKLGWVSDLLIAGSLASGDYIEGVSDLDLVAVTRGPVGEKRQAVLASLHPRWDRVNLGCAYIDGDRIGAGGDRHPTWTHGRLVQRIVSGITRAELVTFGRTVFGRQPLELFPAMTADDVRAAARAELTGYWAWAARRPWLWLDPVIADLGLTSMARGRHALRTGELLTKSEAVEQAAAPASLIGQLRARRRGEPVRSPRMSTAWIAWHDARRTTRSAGPS
ncbi:hypothetical protein [Actinoplanes derwentensis]|uniref:Nucleotidyltransferase domain-containing protein n=1 Tax=Actinoplanes derwentensis TaxID=113562 RepID=A0A1H1VQX3_9ACTN|nr:hypothetical protein [Actinoplanes derwentensis]GID83610.1 nucleotidyltransferase [Actinoplanes derwentensis]SDS87358.1 hypothetical protein SAMN04489716_1852 [Actinoplanes derwentensis]